jgi:histidine transport system permease protein
MIDIIQQYGLAFLYTDGYTMTGVAMTLWILVASCFAGFFLAVPLAVARNAKNALIRGPVWIYVFVFTGTPLYVQLLILYTGVYSLSIVQQTPLINAFFREGINCTILAFTLNTGAYTTQIFAGAMRELPHGEIEAAKAVGMSPFVLYRRIVIPSALRRALPMYSNEVIFMLHSTTLAFTVTVPDILKIANDANSATYKPFDAFGIAAALYLCISFALVFMFRRAERHFLAFLPR